MTRFKSYFARESYKVRLYGYDKEWGIIMISFPTSEIGDERTHESVLKNCSDSEWSEVCFSALHIIFFTIL